MTDRHRTTTTGSNRYPGPMRRPSSVLLLALVAVLGTAAVVSLVRWAPSGVEPRAARAERGAPAPAAAGTAEVEPAALAERTARIRHAALQSKAAAVGAAVTGPFEFGLTQFNILGSNHTAPGSDADHFAPGTIRTEWAASLVDDIRADVVGFSEIQRDQLATFDRAAGGAFDAYPGTSLGGSGIAASLVWRRSVFTAVEKRSVTIPFMGQQRQMPYVKLRHDATGRVLWVMNVHNAPRDRQAERDVARAREIAILVELRRSGLPVFFVGDMNEKAEIFCDVTEKTDLEAAQGGTNDGVTCRPPADMRVDWIFGSSDARFTSFSFDRSTPVRRITDHHVLVSRVRVP